MGRWRKDGQDDFVCKISGLCALVGPWPGVVGVGVWVFGCVGVWFIKSGLVIAERAQKLTWVNPPVLPAAATVVLQR